MKMNFADNQLTVINEEITEVRSIKRSRSKREAKNTRRQLTAVISMEGDRMTVAIEGAPFNSEKDSV